MSRRVVKFGGSCFKNREQFSRVIDIVSNYSERLVVVVSALYGVTDRLEDAVREVKKSERAVRRVQRNLYSIHEDFISKFITDRTAAKKAQTRLAKRVEKLGKYLMGVHCLEDIPNCADDMLLSYGERLSSLLLCEILEYSGVECKEMLPEDIGLVTDGNYGNATIDLELSRRNIRSIFTGDTVYIIPGYYGISTAYRITTFGRGGSDYSASSVAHCIEAESLDIWKDVSGFMSADPSVVKNPVSIKTLSYNEASELSYFGARIFHPLTFEALLGDRIPVRIFDMGNPGRPVSKITRKGNRTRTVIKSIACLDDIGAIKLESVGLGIKSRIINRVISEIAARGINIKTAASSMTSMIILADREDLDSCYRILSEFGPMEIDRVQVQRELSLLSLVGEGMDRRKGIAARVIKTVSEKKINIRLISYGSSGVAMYLVVDRKHRTGAIRALHREFFEER